MNVSSLPVLEGVEHRFVDLGGGVTIHAALRWLVRGEFNDTRVDVPVRWLHAMGDPVITPTLLRGYADRIKDFQIETVEGAGHWIVEQRPDLVLDRLRAFLRDV